MARASSLKMVLQSHTAAGTLYQPQLGKKVRCVACGHRCLISDGREGVCRVRFNHGGTLYVPHGYVGALQIDPIEKKPFFHFLPGTEALSFGMLGCDLHCAYCQNWVTSQALRDEQAVAPIEPISAQGLVDLAVERGVPTIISTYNEPLITSEWAVEVFAAARERGLATGFVSNGNGTPEVLDYLLPHLDAYKVDLKGFDDRHYRTLGGVLSNVLETIESLVARGVWVEVVTLVVPGFNDSDAELKKIARFLAGIRVDLPWHVTAFHPDYRMTTPRPTGPDDLTRAYAAGKEAGLQFVYAGNRPGQVDRREDTVCPDCGATLVARTGFQVESNRLTPAGGCPDCGKTIPGRWTTQPNRQEIEP